MQENYLPKSIELATQADWEKQKIFEAVETASKEKFYCLSMLPYPSGEIHMGHVRNYTIGDVIARFQRMQGKNVLQPLGWDSFGLPAENAALKNRTSPANWTYKNIEGMRTTLKRLGFAIDWRRELTTSKPDYYRWEQWLFLRMYEKGLAYKKKASVNWDPIDQTVLANEQVIDGRGWRSGALIERKEIEQWFLKITAYADELLDSLNNLLGWPEEVKTMQRNWIGRSYGVELDFYVKDLNEKITVFTTRPDTLYGVTYLAISPEHPLVFKALEKNKKIANFHQRYHNLKVAEASFATLEKEGINTEFQAIHPLTKQSLPVWIANFVLTEYGSGAVMSVPAHDERDFAFAQKYGLKIAPTIKPKDSTEWNFNKAPFTADGILCNSDIFNDFPSREARKHIADHLKKLGLGRDKKQYRLRDWGVSRQRYWGTPIPMINCPYCGTLPVKDEDLPVILPENLSLKTPHSPLKSIPSFFETKCPKCKTKAYRENDTLDTFVDSSWYYARYCSFDQSQAILDKRVDYWLPIDHYIGGIEHAVMHLLYARFIHKILRDLDLVHCDEPFTNLLTQGMVLKDGAKMSKSKGNIVSSQKIVDKYGADTMRLFIIFAAPPENSLEWSDSGIEGAHRFLKKIWQFAYYHQDQLRKINEIKSDLSLIQKKLSEDQKTKRLEIHKILKQADTDIERLQLNTLVSATMKLLNLLQKITGTKQDDMLLIREGLSVLLRLLAPITPHITHYLWRELKFKGEIIDAAWPTFDPEALITSEVMMIVQINGKLRAKISVPKNANGETIKQIALANEKINNFMEQRLIKKYIVVPNRLINLIV